MSLKECLVYFVNQIIFCWQFCWFLNLYAKWLFKILALKLVLYDIHDYIRNFLSFWGTFELPNVNIQMRFLISFSGEFLQLDNIRLSKFLEFSYLLTKSKQEKSNWFPLKNSWDYKNHHKATSYKMIKNLILITTR